MCTSVVSPEQKKHVKKIIIKNKKLCPLNSMCIHKIFCKFYITRYRLKILWKTSKHTNNQSSINRFVVCYSFCCRRIWKATNSFVSQLVTSTAHWRNYESLIYPLMNGLIVFISVTFSTKYISNALIYSSHSRAIFTYKFARSVRNKTLYFNKLQILIIYKTVC